jgi:membrane peptidoglycan carboxypeptidase
VRALAVLRLLLAVITAGVLLAAVALPWVATPVVTAVHVIREPEPSAIAEIDRPSVRNTRMLAADGSVIAEFYTHNRVPVPADKIAPVMAQALLAIEDSRFYEHRGIDPIGTVRAAIENLRSGSNEQGGSTITQQLVKQMLLEGARTAAEREAAVADTLGRKAVEARLALALEERLSKEEILTRYLNTVYFGSGAYGVQVAARTYFDTAAADLTLLQAAMLAGLVQNPSADDPLQDPEAATERRNQVLARMHDLGQLTAAELEQLSAEPLGLRPGDLPSEGCPGARIGGFFCDHAERYLTERLGISPEQLAEGGLTIRTTLQPDLQRAGDEAVVRTLPTSDSRAVIYTVVEPGSGEVLAMSVNRRFGCSESDCTSVDLHTTAARGSGSTYKLFTTVAALERGLRFDFAQRTSDPYVSRVYKRNGGTEGAPYTVENAGDYPPRLNMADALVLSSNTYFVALEDRLGSIEGPVRAAQKLGLTSLTDDIARTFIDGRFGSFTLGPIATSPLALANSYATIFSGGTRCEPTAITEVLDAEGAPLTDREGTPLDLGHQCEEDVVPEALARTVSVVLRADVETVRGTGRRANVPGHQIAGKTGTSQNNHSVAFVGSTPEFTASVMVLNPDEAEDVGGFGGNKPAQTWHDAMAPVLADREPASFGRADPRYLGRLARSTGSGCSFQVVGMRLPC